MGAQPRGRPGDQLIGRVLTQVDAGAPRLVGGELGAVFVPGVFPDAFDDAAGFGGFDDRQGVPGLDDPSSHEVGVEPDSPVHDVDRAQGVERIQPQLLTLHDRGGDVGLAADHFFGDERGFAEGFGDAVDVAEFFGPPFQIDPRTDRWGVVAPIW